MKKKFKYLPSDIGLINHIFHENNINVSFENVDDYYNSLNQISYITYKSYIKYINSNVWSKKTEEYNLTKQNIVSKGKYCYYHSSLLQDDKKIHLHMTAIRDLFCAEYSQSSVYDLDQEFGIIYDQSLKVKKKYEYHLSSHCLSDIKKDSLISFLEDFRIPECFHNNFVELSNNNSLFLDDFHFNFINELIQVGFVAEKNSSLKNIFIDLGQTYQKLQEVINFLYDFCDSTVVKLSFSPQLTKDNFSSIEIKVKSSDIKLHIQYLLENNLIADESYFNNVINTMKYDSLYLKFLWTKNKKLNIILTSCLGNSDNFLLNNVEIIDD